jgi:hypothetical protein
MEYTAQYISTDYLAKILGYNQEIAAPWAPTFFRLLLTENLYNFPGRNSRDNHIIKCFGTC